MKLKIAVFALFFLAPPVATAQVSFEEVRQYCSRAADRAAVFWDWAGDLAKYITDGRAMVEGIGNRADRFAAEMVYAAAYRARGLHDAYPLLEPGKQEFVENFRQECMTGMMN